jgi:hypothetical protein
MAARIITLAMLLAVFSGSAATPDEPKTIEVARPVGIWSNMHSPLEIKQDRLVWNVNHPSMGTITLKADYSITKDSILYAVITEVGRKNKEIEEGDTFSFRFRVDDDTLNLKELRGKFVSEPKLKDQLEGIYRKMQPKPKP